MELAVVVPIYKECPSKSEINSFIQCYKILGNYSIKIITYKGLDLSIYEGLIGSKLDCVFFNKHYFSSIEGYNHLLKKHSFYNRFSNFQYILIYQLDAWVFKDELLLWCLKGYDYIGSPWFEHFGSYQMGNRLWAVGNGGFSLRRVDKFQSLTRPFSIFKNYQHLNKEESASMSLFQLLGNCVMIYYYLSFSKVNEDVYFSNIAEKYTKQKVKIPDVYEAACFSFEQSPSYLFQLTGKIPFGCHGWEKHEKEFWSDKIIF